MERVNPPGLFRLVHFQAGNLPAQLRQGFVGLPVGRCLFLQLAEAVQIPQVAGLVQQLLTVVLAVDVNELAAQGTQLDHGAGHAPHPADVFPVCLDLPGQEQLSVFVRADPHLLKPGQVGQVPEQGGHQGGLLPGADQVPAGALPHDGADGVDDDGLARAGLAGEHVEPGAEGEIRPIDEGDVLNMKQ